MEIKFTVPGPPKGQRDVASMSHAKKARAMSLFACAETGRELPARAPRRPRICKVNGCSVAYTPKQTIEYERLVRARCVAALAKSRPNPSALDKPSFTRKGLNASESTQCLDNLSSRNGSGSYPLERNLPLEISILALFPIPKYVSRKTKELMLNGRLFPTKKPDADNIIKVILDALNGLAYRDDSQICRVYFDSQCRAAAGKCSGADE